MHVLSGERETLWAIAFTSPQNYQHKNLFPAMQSAIRNYADAVLARQRCQAAGIAAGTRPSRKWGVSAAGTAADS